MTRQEIAELVAALPEGLDADEFIHRLVNWAVDREREECAKVVEAGVLGHGECAAAIRARGER